jgi:uncharacterized protein (DUF305 family)
MTVVDDIDDVPGESKGRSGPASGLLIGLAAIALTLVGMLVGVLIAPDDNQLAAPALESVDVGFAQDMSVHHNQAIEMSAMALDRSTDPAVRALAYDVLTSQQN